MKVLVVDDEFDVAEILRLVFEERGDEVWTANDGAEAKEILGRGTPDLVITDIMMPLVSGIDLVDWMRTEPRLGSVPVLLMSAIRPPTRDGHWQGFLQKPFTLPKLLRSVEEITGSP